MPVLFPRFISLRVSLNFVYHTTHPSIENYKKKVFVVHIQRKAQRPEQ